MLVLGGEHSLFILLKELFEKSEDRILTNSNPLTYNRIQEFGHDVDNHDKAKGGSKEGSCADGFGVCCTCKLHLIILL